MLSKILFWQLVLVQIFLLKDVVARKHHLEIRNDYRRYIALSTFGFYRDGILDVNFHNFQLTKPETTMLFGLSLDKTMTDAMNPYLDTHQDRCILSESAADQHHGPIMFFKMKPAENVTQISCSNDWQSLHIYKNRSEIPITSLSRGLEKISDSSLFLNRNRRAAVGNNNNKRESSSGNPVGGCGQQTIPLTHTVKDGVYSYSFSFIVFIGSEEEEGLYNLYFHSCPNYDYNPAVALNFNVDIEENNHGNYLSAGEMPLPALYFMMSILFLLSGIFWVFILRKSRHPVFKIHYLMAGLVFLKSLSLLFHAINFHFIEIKGEHVAAWAILYYITHLMKGAVLFTTIVLIGSGWTIIKHFLTDRDKKIFMVIIPLQVLANIADIILAESEEGDIEHRTWADILIMVDLICCGAILFPVVGSIKHFQEASTTDGKAAVNLRKLKLFRQFYIMVVGYIYFTRIIVYLLRVTVPWTVSWMDEMFREMATFAFFASTGYKFRPASAHPYFSVGDHEDDDDVEEEALTECGLTEGLSKVHNRSAPPTNTNSSSSVTAGGGGLRAYDDSNGEDEEERQNLLSKRESSHEYD